MEPILKLEHIQKYYGSEGIITKAIRDISFSVKAGEFLGIMGASGSGKTTLLNCISTIDTVSAGHIYLEGTDITEIKPKSLARFRRENLGFVFQDFNLLDTLTISEKLKQLGVWFGLPVLVAAVASAVVIAYFVQTVSAEISAYIGFENLMLQIGTTAGILLLLLTCYFLTTWLLFRGSVSKS